MNPNLRSTSIISGTYRRIPLAPHQLTTHITPVENLFVLAHLGIPRIDAANWRLEICGAVRKARTIDFEELRGFQKLEIESFHQCAGDPTNPTHPKRRIANVRWGGVRLTELLEAAGVRDEATHVWSYGSDRGEFAGDQHEYYLKDMPIGCLKKRDVLVAYEVNGVPLPPEHGYPVRLVIPGYYGTNSVKWLYRVELADRRAGGPFTTRFYNDPANLPGEHNINAGRPVWAVPVESVIVSPAPDLLVRHGCDYQISGWAWADSGVRCVELSDDGGRSWWDARLSLRTDTSWQSFSSPWTARIPSPACNDISLLARATSNDGIIQPLKGARNCVHSVAVKIVMPASP